MEAADRSYVSVCLSVCCTRLGSRSVRPSVRSVGSLEGVRGRDEHDRHERAAERQEQPRVAREGAGERVGAAPEGVALALQAAAQAPDEACRHEPLRHMGGQTRPAVSARRRRQRASREHTREHEHAPGCRAPRRRR